MTKKVLTVLAAAPVIASAQKIAMPIIPRPRPFPPMPPIVFKMPENAQALPVRITNMKVNAEINGVLAETTVTIDFHNPNSRTLEGELAFPLPTDATVSGYALDVNGKMVDGVIVPKEKARVVFDELVRTGIDPGLVEQSAGNTFKTRIYPLLANGTRTIRFTYVSKVAIVTEENRRAAYYVQPLRVPNKLDSFELNISVAAAQKAPEVVAGNLSGLTFTSWQSAYTAKTELKDIELTEDLYVDVMTRPEESLAVQKALDGTQWFAYDKTLDISKLNAAAARPLRPCVLWDASYSRSKSDHDAELSFLKLALAKADAIDLLVFRNEPEPLVTVTSVQELAERLEKTIYDGGTAFSRALKAAPKDSEILLFSDGLDTLSPESETPLSFARLSAFFSDKDQNAPCLRGLAARNGGVCIDLRTTSPQDAVALLASRVPSLSAVRLGEKDITASCLWQLNGDRLSVTGPADGDSSVLEITVAVGTDKLTFSCKDMEKLSDGNLVKTLFGQMKIAGMIENKASEKEMVAVSRQFNLVTPATSMMVLDSLDQYLRYGIRPPASLPDMQKEYDKRHKQDSAEDDGFKLKPNSVEQVVRLWNSVVTWHKTDFPHVQEPVAKHAPPVNRPTAARPGLMARAVNALFGNATEATAIEDRADYTMAVGAPAPAPVMDRVAEAPRNRLARASRESTEGMAAAQEKTTATKTPVTGPRTTLQPWTPDTPYLKEIKENKDGAYDIYLAQRKSFGEAPGFYMDCADYFISCNQKALAVRILTTIAELEAENKALLRIMAYKLRFLGELELAETIFRKVILMAREEPQSYRDLALTLDDQEKFQEAVDTMMTIVNYKFDSRFPEIETIALTEINRFIARAKRKGIEIKNVDKQFIHLVDTDIRIVLNWDADMTDMDLWTTDSFGVKCFYGNRRTPTGGFNSCDFTQGYGPEAFMIRDAVKGNYTIQANYYGSHSQKVLGPVTLYTEVFTNYGRPDEKKQVLTYRLTGARETVTVGTISHDGTSKPRPHDEPFQYQVKTGDTLESIAQAQLGDVSRVNDILKLNPGLKADAKLRIGSIITLPETK